MFQLETMERKVNSSVAEADACEAKVELMEGVLVKLKVGTEEVGQSLVFVFNSGGMIKICSMNFTFHQCFWCVKKTTWLSLCSPILFRNGRPLLSIANLAYSSSCST